MALIGKLMQGGCTVKIEGKTACGTTDKTEHGGDIMEGSPNVLYDIPSCCAARQDDRFVCTLVEAIGPHVGGWITGGAARTLINGKAAARQDDETVCCTSPLELGPMPDKATSGAKNPDADCAALWAKYEKMGHDVVDPFADDPRARNRAISGAYADLYLNNPAFRWAGLAAYASKQVGCAMDFAANSPPGASDFATKVLGDGNRDLFLDVYPMHKFFQEQGAAKFAACAAARVPPVSAAAQRAFKFAQRFNETGDKAWLNASLAALAWHEQMGVLQNQVYNDPFFQAMLRANQVPTPLTDPASVVMGAGCTPGPGDDVHQFGGPTDDLSDPTQRMNWILNKIGQPYNNGLADSAKHRSDMSKIRDAGSAQGAQYP